jgi:hypothetical protein
MRSGLLGIALFVACFPALSAANNSQQSSRPAARLQGKVGGYQWVTEVRHGKRVGISPCLSVQLYKKERGSLGGMNTVCGSFSPFPLLVEESSGIGESKHAAVGMVFPTNVTKVRVILRSRSLRQLSLHLLTKAQAKTGGVKVLRYGTFVFSGPTCISRIVPYDQAEGKWNTPGVRGGCGH